MYITPSTFNPIIYASADNKRLDIPVNVNLNFWGFTSTYNSLGNYLQSHLNSSITLYSKDSKNNIPQIENIIINGQSYEISSRIKYSYNNINNISGLIAKLNSSATKGLSAGYTEIGGVITPIAGWRIPISTIDDFLAEYNTEGVYTINILNLASINGDISNGSTHWYMNGKTYVIEDKLMDMRNLGLVGNNGVFIDPTALSYRFDPDNYWNYTTEPDNAGKYLANRLNQIVSSIIIGNPKGTANDPPIDQKFHFAQIIVGKSDRDKNFLDAINDAGYASFRNALHNLLPYVDLEYSNIQIDLETYTKIADFLDKKTDVINGQQIIFVDTSFAESMKYLVRSDTSLYKEYPSGYYYPVFIMVDGDRKYVVETSSEQYTDYEVGEIGFSLVDMSEWEKLSDKPSDYVLYRSLEAIGRMMGLSILDNFTAQIESPMSRYGVTNNWDKRFTSLERDIIARRMSLVFNYTAYFGIQTYRDNLKHSFYFWVNRTSLDIAETRLMQANLEYRSGDYLSATNAYLNAYETYINATKHIDLIVSSVNNSFYIIAMVALLVFIISSFRSFGIPYNKFIDKIKRLKELDKELKK